MKAKREKRNCKTVRDSAGGPRRDSFPKGWKRTAKGKVGFDCVAVRCFDIT